MPKSKTAAERQASGNQKLAAAHFQDGKLEHAEFAYRMARLNMGIRDQDQYYA